MLTETKKLGTPNELVASGPAQGMLDLRAVHPKWSWACRILDRTDFEVDRFDSADSQVGDVVLVRVDDVGFHGSVVDIWNRKLRIYTDDLVVGVLGNRYATDAVEGEVDGLQDLSLLTAAGLIGTVKSKHETWRKSTDVSFVGFVKDKGDQRVNLKGQRVLAPIEPGPIQNLIAIVGTGMNSGKTTSACKLIRESHRSGLRVAACKLTGSVSPRDTYEMRSASAKPVIDFSDYGFPSTYLCTRTELLGLFNRMIADVSKTQPDVVVMEIADGLLQRETAMLLREPAIRQAVKGVIVTADCAPSALHAVDELRQLGFRVLAVSGKITSSPLFVKEFEQRSEVPVASSAGSGRELAARVSESLLPDSLDVVA
jgi:hypothetical protein